MTEPLRIDLLGPVQIRRGERAVSGFISGKAQALLIYLAVTGQPHSRDRLAGLLWGGMPDRAARTNLRQVLSNLRRLVGEHLSIARETVSLNRSVPYRLDVEEFASLFEQAQTAPPQEQVPLFRSAVEFYRGDLAEGFYVRNAPSFEEWLLLQRERFQEMACRSLQTLVDHYSRYGDTSAGVLYAQRLLRLDPWLEETHRQLMLLLGRQGHYSAALRQYQACREVLAQELGVEPAEETQALYRRLRAARATRVQNLPRPTTPFVGRAGELAAILDLLSRPTCHLLTLVGPGGIGKTRLALRVAEEKQGAFLHGVCFLSLAAIHSAEFLPLALAETLGGPWEKGQILPQLLRYLQDKELLLVLDGFEHLAAGADLIARIITTAAESKILITSQKRLGLQGEWVFEVGGMALPPPAPQEPIAAHDAAQLFLLHARRVHPALPLTPEDQRAIARICRSVDGMPLGIELAASWSQTLSCTEIALEIERDLDILTASWPDVPPQQRSLRATLERSWSLLGLEEQATLPPLSLFEGGFRQEAAREVAGVSPALLSSLVQRSFLSRDAAGRYTMHSVLQRYLREKLNPAQKDRLRARHCAFYMAFLQQREEAMREKRQGKVLQEVQAEVGNLRAAWQWGPEAGRWADLDAGLDGLYWFYYLRGWAQEGQQAMEQALTRLVGEKDPATFPPEKGLLAARLASRWASLALHLGLYEEARGRLHASMTWLAELKQDTRREQAFCLNELGVIAWWTGDLQQSQQHYRQALDLARALNRHRSVATILNNLGLIAQDLGDLDQAQRLYQEGLDLFEALGDRWGEALTCDNLGTIAEMCGDYTRARERYQRALSLLEAIGQRFDIARVRNNLGFLFYLQGEYEEAQTLFQESLALAQEGNHAGLEATAQSNLGLVCAATGRLQEAWGYLREALQRAMEVGATPTALNILTDIASLWERAGEKERAAELAAFVQAHPATIRAGRDAATQLWRRLEEDLPADLLAVARQHARERTLEAVVHALLRHRPNALAR